MIKTEKSTLKIVIKGGPFDEIASKEKRLKTAITPHSGKADCMTKTAREENMTSSNLLTDTIPMLVEW